MIIPYQKRTDIHSLLLQVLDIRKRLFQLGLQHCVCCIHVCKFLFVGFAVFTQVVRKIIPLRVNIEICYFHSGV